MPRPSSSTVVPRHDLGAIAYEYTMESEKQGYIAGEIFPIFPTTKQAASYPVIPIEAFMKRQKTRRAARGAFPRSDYEFEDGNYSCKQYGWEELAEDTEVELYNSLFDVEEIAAIRATDVILRDREIRVAAQIFNTSNFGKTDVTTEWSTAASCTPKADVKGAMTTLRLACGLRANAIVMSETVFDNVMICAELKNYLQYTDPHLISTLEAQRRMLARYFGVEKVLVAGAMYDSAKKGQSKSLADIWDDEYVWLGRVAPNTERQDLKDPVVGRTFLWTDVSPEIINMETYREEQTSSTVVRTTNYLDEAFVFSGAGYLLGNITA